MSIAQFVLVTCSVPTGTVPQFIEKEYPDYMICTDSIGVDRINVKFLLPCNITTIDVALVY